MRAISTLHRFSNAGFYLQSRWKAFEPIYGIGATIGPSFSNYLRSNDPQPCPIAGKYMQQQSLRWVLESCLPMVLDLTDNSLSIGLLPYYPCSLTCLADILLQCSTRLSATQTVVKIGTGTAIWCLADTEGLSDYSHSQSAPPIIPNPDPGPRAQALTTRRFCNLTLILSLIRAM